MFKVINKMDGLIYQVYDIIGDNETGVLFLVYKQGIGFSYDFQGDYVPFRSENE